MIFVALFGWLQLIRWRSPHCGWITAVWVRSVPGWAKIASLNDRGGFAEIQNL
jgi:hypothetical protein